MPAIRKPNARRSLNPRCPTCNGVALVDTTDHATIKGQEPDEKSFNPPDGREPDRIDFNPEYYRRRRRFSCEKKHVWSTIEIYETEPLLYLKRRESKGGLQPLDRAHLMQSIHLADPKLPGKKLNEIALRAIEILRSHHFAPVPGQIVSGAVVYSPKDLGEAVLQALFEEEEVAAYWRYSVLFRQIDKLSFGASIHLLADCIGNNIARSAIVGISKKNDEKE